MTIQEKKQYENYIYEQLRVKYPDIKVHIDEINETKGVKVTMFWNRISSVHWECSKSFQIKADELKVKIETEILQNFKKY